MAKLDFPGFEKHLGAFDFARLFIDVLGWNSPNAEREWQTDQAGETSFSRRTVAELGGVVAIQVVTQWRLARRGTAVARVETHCQKPY